MSEEWQRLAACSPLADQPDIYDVFFPEDLPDRERRKNTASAKAVCAQCPVGPQCLEYGIRTGSPVGIFGGLTADERFAFVRSPLRVRNLKRQLEESTC